MVLHKRKRSTYEGCVFAVLLLVSLVFANAADAQSPIPAVCADGSALEDGVVAHDGYCAGIRGEHNYGADPWELARSPVIGSPDALVTIVQFAEFQCPFSARVEPTVRAVLDAYNGDVRIVFKHLPLDFHDRALPAARAAIAAHEQGRFWDFHDLAFANQRDLTDETFLAWAEEIGLDVDRFRADLENATLHDRMDADRGLANELGVRGTPHFVINGRAVTGAQSFEVFAEAIDNEIAAVQLLLDAGHDRVAAYEQRVSENRAAAAAGPVQTTPPASQRADPSDELYVPVGDSPVLGPDDAMITIVAFAEFQCPFCARVQATLNDVRHEFPDDVRIVFKHNPLSFHDRAVPAAHAAIAAHNQGQFWAFHDLLLANQNALSDENFVVWAGQLGLDTDQFLADMASDETAARVAEDRELARRVAARGAPHFFINGIRLRGAQPYEAFEELINQQLRVARSAVDDGVSREEVYEHLQAEANRGEAVMLPVDEESAPAPTPVAADRAVAAEPNTANRGGPAPPRAQAEDLYGTWTVDFVRSLQESPSMSDEERVRAIDLFGGMRMNIVFDADGTMTMDMDFMGEQKSETGSWEVTDTSRRGLTIVATSLAETGEVETNVAEVTFVSADTIRLVQPSADPDAASDLLYLHRAR